MAENQIDFTTERYGPRFTVRHWAEPKNNLRGHLRYGWIVCAWGKRITIPFATKEEAGAHRDNIAAIYQRFGWDEP